jgi:hypothetical protein
MKSTVGFKKALAIWLGGVSIVVLPGALILLLTYRAYEISRNPMLTNWMEIWLLVGSSYLLFSKRGSADVRVAVEISIWLATTINLVFKYVSAPVSLVIVFIAVCFTFGFAFWRGAKGPTELK